MNTINWRRVVQLGLIMGVVVLTTSVIGMVQTFDERDMIEGLLTLGQLLLFAPAFYAGFMAAGRGEHNAPLPSLLAGALAGALAAVPAVLLVGLATVWTNIRDYFVNVSPQLIEILTFGREPLPGSLLLLGVMAGMGLIGAAMHLIPLRIRRPLMNALLFTLGFSLFSDVPLNIANQFLERNIVRLFFPTKGITLLAAIAIFMIALAFAFWWEWRGRAWREQRQATLAPETRRRNSLIALVVALIILLVLPRILGIFLINVVDQVGTFVLMALGLNIVVGFAGLLDLGYVAFFAVGAYVTALLTSTGDLGLGVNFWIAMPIGVAMAVLAGIFLGIPVLRLRGDYLAIVTLGFGEIIRVLVRSDLLKPVIGGAQGILEVGRPNFGSFAFVTPQHYYYLILAGCVLALFVAWRLRDGRPGRQWMAIREDEDVAEAVGIHLVGSKLLAFAIGAGFAGLSGAIFGSRVGSVFPNSFELLISINVLAIIIVGGVGSLPGVILGAFVLVGLPELLREFVEFRLLIYGVLLIVMMLVRPEGLWPSAVRKRELHADAETAALEGIHHEEVQPLM
jgi:branched-chain amino acid transport system permease protein